MKRLPSSGAVSQLPLYFTLYYHGNNQTGIYSAGFSLIATAPAFAYKLVGSGVVYSLTREKWPIEKPSTHITGRLSYILAASGRPRRVGRSQRMSNSSFVWYIWRSLLFWVFHGLRYGEESTCVPQGVSPALFLTHISFQFFISKTFRHRQRARLLLPTRRDSFPQQSSWFLSFCLLLLASVV
jgi:hypothetical protein